MCAVRRGTIACKYSGVSMDGRGEERTTSETADESNTENKVQLTGPGELITTND